jgi:hypothetical protein
MMPSSSTPTNADDVTEDRASALIERLGTFADLLVSDPLEGPKGGVAYDLLREAAAQISSDRLRIRIAHESTGQVERLREGIEKLRSLSKRASKGPWRKFTSQYGNDTIAIMQGDAPDRDDRGYHLKRWPEIISWQGFDSSDMPESRRHVDARFIVACVNFVRAALAIKGGE